MKTIKLRIKSEKSCIAGFNFHGAGAGAPPEREEGEKVGDELRLTTFFGAVVAIGNKGEPAQWGVALDGEIHPVPSRDEAIELFGQVAHEVCLQRPSGNIVNVTDEQWAECYAGVARALSLGKKWAGAGC